MAKQRNQQRNQVKSDSGLNVLFAGVVCLAVGLGIGYYFGRQTVPPAPVASATAPMPNPPQGTVANPSDFLDNEASLKLSLARNPKDLNSLVRLGNLYYDHGKFREAVDWYGRALEIEPNDVNVRTDRGTSYWSLGDADSAIAEFNRSLQSNPTHAQTLYNLGVVYLHGKNNTAQARLAWEKLLATNPDYPDRVKLQQQIAQLSSSPAASSPAPSPGVRDLLQQLKKP